MTAVTPRRRVLTKWRAAGVVATGFAVVLLAMSTKTTVQVFFVSMADTFGQSRGQFAVAASVFMIVFGVASPVVGKLGDRVGPKRTILFGVVSGGLGFLLGGLSPGFVGFVLAYGVLGALAFAAMTYVPMGLLVEEYLPERRRGFLYALLTNAAAFGFVVLSPLWVMLDDMVSWRAAYGGLAIVFLGPLLVAAYFGIPRRLAGDSDEGESDGEGEAASAEVLASDGGLSDTATSDGAARDGAAPDGAASGGSALAGSESGEQAVAAAHRPVLKTKVFYVLAGAFFGCGVTMAFIDVHTVAHFHDVGLSDHAISLALILLGTTEVVGALLAGYLCDRHNKAFILAGAYVLRTVAMVVLLVSPSGVGAGAFAAVFGFSYMGTVIATAMLVFEEFDAAQKGWALGLVWFAHQLGALASTQLGAMGRDIFDSYAWTIGLTAAVGGLSALLIILYAISTRRPPHEEPVETEPQVVVTGGG